ncbi:hypothetical protein M0813_12178 [Anaeramoeba flamelloides]|uniref:MMS19 nucleotide excision repair protein n=1 Tax=Anaeramoeba flamelloides TaxID=1746091 RepID=A0ABQ8ZCT3_9EUKA|nr:hypothetical protein M0813_12178 [Anaeramoeba flamelloides]
MKILILKKNNYYSKVLNILKNNINKAEHYNIEIQFLVLEEILYLGKYIDQTLIEVIEIMNQNLQYPKVTIKCIKLFQNIIKKNPKVNNWFLINLEKWYKKWIILTKNKQVINEIEILLQTIISQIKEENEEIVKLFQYLLNKLPEEIGELSKQNLNKNSTKIRVKDFILMEKLDLMKSCIKGERSKKILYQNFDIIWNLYQILLDQNLQCDLNMKHLLMFLEKVLIGSQSNIELITLNSLVQRDLLDFQISLSPDSKTIYYNQSILPIYFRIITMCSNASKDFQILLIDSKILKVCVEQFLLKNSQYKDLSSIIFQIIKNKLVKFPQFRNKYIEFLLSDISFWKLSPKNTLTLLDYNLINLNDSLLMCGFKGHVMLSAFIKNRLVKIDSLNNDNIELLNYSCNILRRALAFVKNYNSNKKSILQIIQNWELIETLKSSIIKSLEIINILYPNLLPKILDLLQITLLANPLQNNSFVSQLLLILKKNRPNDTGINNFRIIKKDNYLLNKTFLEIINNLLTVEIQITKHGSNHSFEIMEMVCLFLIISSPYTDFNLMFINLLLNIIPNKAFNKDFQKMITKKYFRQYLLNISQNVNLLQNKDCVKLLKYLFNFLSVNISSKDSLAFIRIFANRINKNIQDFVGNVLGNEKIKHLKSTLNLLLIIAKSAPIWKKLINLCYPDIVKNLTKLSNSNSLQNTGVKRAILITLQYYIK